MERRRPTIAIWGGKLREKTGINRKGCGCYEGVREDSLKLRQGAARGGGEGGRVLREGSRWGEKGDGVQGVNGEAGGIWGGKKKKGSIKRGNGGKIWNASKGKILGPVYVPLERERKGSAGAMRIGGLKRVLSAVGDCSRMSARGR